MGGTTAALLAVGAWGGKQYFCRIQAEQSIADMKTKQLEDAKRDLGRAE